MKRTGTFIIIGITLCVGTGIAAWKSSFSSIHTSLFTDKGSFKQKLDATGKSQRVIYGDVIIGKTVGQKLILLRKNK